MIDSTALYSEAKAEYHYQSLAAVSKSRAIFRGSATFVRAILYQLSLVP